jgi:hypothetical protein
MKTLRKTLILLIFIFPVFVSTDCKKQAKCGCNGDVVDVLTKEQAKVIFNDNGTSIYCTPLSNPYATYMFCNPGEMFPKLADVKSGDILLVSGNAYWECNFLYQQSNYSYYSSAYKVFQIQVTDVVADLYGKKK